MVSDERRDGENQLHVVHDFLSIYESRLGPILAQSDDQFIRERERMATRPCVLQIVGGFDDQVVGLQKGHADDLSLPLLRTVRTVARVCSTGLRYMRIVRIVRHPIANADTCRNRHEQVSVDFRRIRRT
jgi:hypothetical protein